VNMEELESRFGPMAESEAKLRGYLDKLDRPSSGMVSDFDLHTKHCNAPASIHEAVSDSKLDICPPAPVSEVPSKRRKTGARSSVSIATSKDIQGKGEARQSARRISRRTSQIDEGRRDFRTVSVSRMLLLFVILTSFCPGDPYLHVYSSTRDQTRCAM
jgi:hypothetical protein